MFNTILVPTDGSELSDKAVAAAIAFAKINGAKIVGISVAEPYPFPMLAEAGFSPDTGVFDQKMLELAKQHVQKVESAAKEAGVRCETVTPQSFMPYEEIVNAAKKFGCDVIFMASHGRKGVNKLFVGSETQRVLAHSSIPVMVIR